MDWLKGHRGPGPLIVSLPHTGSDIPVELAGGFVSPWLATRDAERWVDKLYGFATDLGATTIQQAEPLRATWQAILIASPTFTETPSPS